MPCSGTWACSRAALGGVLAAQGGHRQGGACRPDALQQGADQQAASNISDAEQPQEAQSAKAAAPCARGLHIKTAEQHKKEALEAQANSAACKYEWPELQLAVVHCGSYSGNRRPSRHVQQDNSADSCEEQLQPRICLECRGAARQWHEAPAQLCRPGKQEKSSKAAAEQA